MNARRSAVVRITHWITTVSVGALLVSGVAVLLAHPRLYWGETGAYGAPWLINLPLPLILTGQSGWGRSLHFLSAWVAVLTGLVYVVFGFASRYFERYLLPARSDLSWRVIGPALRDHLRPSRSTHAGALAYNVLQRFTYIAVVFALFPAIIWTGLAMSPAITSVFPGLVTVIGGQQSARTLHFFGAMLLVLFVAVHVSMVSVAGFRVRMRGMLTGAPTQVEEGV